MVFKQPNFCINCSHWNSCWYSLSCCQINQLLKVQFSANPYWPWPPKVNNINLLLGLIQIPPDGICPAPILRVNHTGAPFPPLRPVWENPFLSSQFGQNFVWVVIRRGRWAAQESLENILGYICKVKKKFKLAFEWEKILKNFDFFFVWYLYWFLRNWSKSFFNFELFVIRNVSKWYKMLQFVQFFKQFCPIYL